MYLIRLISLFLTLFSSSLMASSPEKVVLITGASRGIGLASAELLADKGYRVYGTVRSLQNTLPSHQNLTFEVLDVTDLASIQKAISKIIEKEGHIDILINNAGYGVAGPIECCSIQDVQEQMDVNFFGVIRMCQEVLPHMRAQKKGRIINISSEQGVYGLPYGSLYTSSKAALESMSEALSIELLPWNIAVSIVEPGLVDTKFSIKMGTRTVEQNSYQKILEKIENSLNQTDVSPQASGQPAEDVAQCLLQIIEDPEPKLRYQTSKAAKEIVSMKLHDLTGDEYSKKMRALIAEYYKE